jgi:hypothetical protein
MDPLARVYRNVRSGAHAELVCGGAARWSATRAFEHRSKYPQWSRDIWSTHKRQLIAGADARPPLLSRIAVQKAIVEILPQIRGDSQLCCVRRHYELLVRNSVTTGINAEFAPLGLDRLYRRRKDAAAQEPS